MNELTTSTVVIGVTQVFNIIFQKLLIPTEFCVVVAMILGGIIHPILQGEFTPKTVVFGVVIGITTTGVINFTEGKIDKYTNRKDK